MHPTPKGYIDLPDAVVAITSALNVPTEEAGVTKPDPEVFDRGRVQASKARDWLRSELLNGNLVAEHDGLMVQAEYWSDGAARTTLNTGRFQMPEIDTGKYTPFANHPCFIEREAFEQRIAIKTSEPSGSGKKSVKAKTRGGRRHGAYYLPFRRAVKALIESRSFETVCGWDQDILRKEIERHPIFRNHQLPKAKQFRRVCDELFR